MTPAKTATGWFRTALICMAVLLEGMSSSSINVQVARIQESFEPDPATLSLVVSCFLVVYAAFLPVAGRLADSRDARTTFTAGLLAFAVGSVLCAAAPAAWAVVAGRSVQGLGAALSAPAAMVLITRGRGEAARSRAIAVYGAMGAVGFSLGLVLPGFVVQAWGWRASFAALLPLVLVVLLATRSLPRAATSSTGRLDLRGAALLVVALMAFMHAVGNIRGDATVLAVEFLVVVVAVLLLHHRRGSALPAAVTAARRVRFAAVILGSVFAAVLASLFVLSLALQHGAGLQPLTVSLLLLPQPLCFSLLAPLGGHLTSRLGARRTIGLGQLLLLLALLVLAVVPRAVEQWPVVLLSMGLVGACLACTFPAATTFGLESVPEQCRGAASGVITTAQNIGGALGLAAVAAGNLTPAPGEELRLAAPMLLCAALLVAGSVAAVALLGRDGAAVPVPARRMAVPS